MNDLAEIVRQHTGILMLNYVAYKVWELFLGGVACFVGGFLLALALIVIYRRD